MLPFCIYFISIPYCFRLLCSLDAIKKIGIYLLLVKRNIESKIFTLFFTILLFHQQLTSYSQIIQAHVPLSPPDYTGPSSTISPACPIISQNTQSIYVYYLFLNHIKFPTQFTEFQFHVLLHNCPSTLFPLKLIPPFTITAYSTFHSPLHCSSSSPIVVFTPISAT